MFIHDITPKKKTKQTIFLDRPPQPETKIKSRFQWLLAHTITVFSCVLIIALGIAVLTHANPGTTTIGENISTGSNLTVGGNATTTGSHYFGSDLSIFGNVGIGTTTPTGAFHVTTGSYILVDTFLPNSSQFAGRGAGGTAGTPTALQANSILVGLSGRGFGETVYSPVSKGAIQIRAAENWTDDAQGAYIAFWTTAAGGKKFNEKLRITDTGNVGIGTTTPGYNFVVNGTTNNFLQVASSTNQGIFVIDSDGNVGIGTTTPGSKLTIKASANHGQVIHIDPNEESQGTYIFFSRGGAMPGNGLMVGTEHSSGASLPNASVIRASGGTNENIGLNPGLSAISGNRGVVEIDETTSATSENNYSSPELRIMGRSYNGTISSLDYYAIQNVISSGANPSTVLTFSHSGSTGNVNYSFSTGNVGIGTTDPNYKLEVSGNTYISGSATTTGSFYGPGSFVIQDNGNVGIGTTTPQAKLEVAGTGYFSDKVGIGTMNPDTLFHVSNNTATSTITVGDELTGGKGACLKLRDSDDAGWTYCSVLDGVITCGTDSCE